MRTSTSRKRLPAALRVEAPSTSASTASSAKTAVTDRVAVIETVQVAPDVDWQPSQWPKRQPSEAAALSVTLVPLG